VYWLNYAHAQFRNSFNNSISCIATTVSDVLFPELWKTYKVLRIVDSLNKRVDNPITNLDFYFQSF
jgi:hypothetical protein